MPGIEDFIQMAARNLGQPEDNTRSATGALLGVLQQKANPNDFQELLGAIPGAASLLGGASGPDTGGGLLGGLLGGKLRGSLGLLADIQKSGFTLESAGQLVSLFLGFAKSNAGEGLVQRLLSQVPELAKLAG